MPEPDAGITKRPGHPHRDALLQGSPGAGELAPPVGASVATHLSILGDCHRRLHTARTKAIWCVLGAGIGCGGLPLIATAVAWQKHLRIPGGSLLDLAVSGGLTLLALSLFGWSLYRLLSLDEREVLRRQIAHFATCHPERVKEWGGPAILHIPEAVAQLLAIEEGRDGNGVEGRFTKQPSEQITSWPAHPGGAERPRLLDPGAEGPLRVLLGCHEQAARAKNYLGPLIVVLVGQVVFQFCRQWILEPEAGFDVFRWAVVSCVGSGVVLAVGLYPLVRYVSALRVVRRQIRFLAERHPDKLRAWRGVDMLRRPERIRELLYLLEPLTMGDGCGGRPTSAVGYQVPTRHRGHEVVQAKGRGLP